MNPSSEKHVFALIWNNPEYVLSSCKINTTITIVNPDICHRIQTILRLSIHDQIILFDHKDHILVEISSITKKQITGAIQEVAPNTINKPEITCAIPLLKREALEVAMDALTQLGATTIQLIITQKIHRSAFGSKELERLQRVIWAGAEQSKNFSFPLLKPPLTIEAFVKSVEQKETFSIFFDPQGVAAFNLLSKIKKEPYNKIILIVGPEGDLTEQEKKVLIHNNVSFMALTPTILRAEQAAALGLGLMRTLL